MDETQGKAAPGRGTGVTDAVEELAEFEFAPLAPSEEVDAQEQILIVGMAPCR